MCEDIKLARRYLAKACSAQARGIEFDLTFQSYKNLCRAKKCKYTGMKLTQGEGDKTRPTDRTIDRVNNLEGYVKGNVVAVCHAANHIKSIWENPDNPLTPNMVKKILEGAS